MTRQSGADVRAAPAAAAAPASSAAAVAPASSAASWILLLLTWCAWLLVWLAPSLLLAPRLALPRPWLTRDTAPAAVMAAASFFLAAVWPFWPGLAGKRGETAQPVSARWVGRSALEWVVLAALAAPFALVAWSVGGRAMDIGPAALAFLGLGVLGLGLRIAAAGMGPGAARWLMLASALACAGPLALEYAAGETMGVTFPRLLEVSPVVSAVRLALGAWPEESWPWIARLWLWPGAGVALGIAGYLESRRRAAAA